MKLSKEKVIFLAREQGISQNALAKQIGVRPGTLSNAINGRRGVGRTVLTAFLRQFPDENVASLTVKTKGRKEFNAKEGQPNSECQSNSGKTLP